MSDSQQEQLTSKNEQKDVTQEEPQIEETVAEIKKDVDKTFGMCVPTDLIYHEIDNYLSQH